MRKIFGLIAFIAFINLSFLTRNIKVVNIDESKIAWKGEKLTGSHTGDLLFQEGQLQFEGDELVGGYFIVDMSSITVTDIEGQKAENLKSHLMSDDFFGVEKHPKAQMKFSQVEKKAEGTYSVVADLTIKGISEPIEFELLVGKSLATTSIKVDRTKYGIKYGSGSFFDDLGDKAIYDEFELDVALVY